jgi:hypothetical protein
MATFELLEQQGQTEGTHVRILSLYGITRRDHVPACEASNRPARRRISAIVRIRTICAGRSECSGRTGEHVFGKR